MTTELPAMPQMFNMNEADNRYKADQQHTLADSLEEGIFNMSAPAIANDCTMDTLGDESSTERRYKCVVCNRLYNSKIYLRDHMTIHSDVRAYECKVCSKRFRFCSNLSEHKTVHMTDNLFYKCTECDYSVRLRGNLKKHMRTHFRDRLSLDGAWKKFASNTPLMADIIEQSQNQLKFRVFVGDLQSQTPMKSQLPDMQDDLKTALDRSNAFMQNKADHTVVNFGDGKRLNDFGVQPRFKPASMMRNCVNELVAAFVKKAEDCASLADSVDGFLSALEDLDIDLIDCPFCGKRFYSFFDCTAHISTGNATHRRPVDEQGRSRFCDKCLRCFESIDALERHKTYHAMVHEMIGAGYVNVTGRLQAFVNEQNAKLAALLAKPNADDEGDGEMEEEAEWVENDDGALSNMGPQVVGGPAELTSPQTVVEMKPFLGMLSQSAIAQLKESSMLPPSFIDDLCGFSVLS